MPRLWVDGVEVEVPEGATLLEAASAAGTAVPTLCDPGTGGEAELHPSCMVCLVEDQEERRLLPSCAARAGDGQRVTATGTEVEAARRDAVELLLGEHVGDCEGPCRRACPAGLDIPAVLRHLAAGREGEAAARVLRDLPLPGVLGHLCTAPCQGACRRGAHDNALALRRLMHSTPAPSDLPEPEGPSVAVVGSGRTGLAAAWHLASRGYRCTVFEAAVRIAPALAAKTATGALPAEALDGDLDTLARMGVRFVPGTRVGGDLSVAEARADHGAVVLCAGAGNAVLQEDSIAAEAGGVFADTSTRPAPNPARAAGRGRKLATAVEFFLGGSSPDPVRQFDCRLGSLRPGEMEVFLAQPGVAGGPGPSATEDLGYAAGEARRCVGCDCAAKRSCRLRRLAGKLGAKQARFRPRERVPVERVAEPGGLQREPGKCVRCGACIAVARRRGCAPGIAFQGRGGELQVAPPPGVTWGEALGSALAEVAAACPTGALYVNPQTPTPGDTA